MCDVNKRDKSIDAVSGLLIIYMICGHAVQLSHIVDNEIYVFSEKVLFFFMAWFFFKSGMFYGNHNHTSSIKKDCTKLIKPFITYTCVGEIVKCILLWMKSDIEIKNYVYTLAPFRDLFWGGSTSGNLALWFLLTFFVVKRLVTICYHKEHNLYILLVVSFFCAGIGNILNDHIRIPYYLLNIPLGLFFYILGILLSKIQYDKINFGFSIIAYIVIIICFPSFVDFRTDRTVFGYWLIYVLSSVFAIITINNIFRLSIFQISLLTKIGRDSMSYFCLHWIILNILSFICLRFNIEGVMKFIVLTPICFILLSGYVYIRNYTEKRIYNIT